MVPTARSRIYTMFKNAVANNMVKSSNNMRIKINSLIGSEFEDDRFILKISEKSIKNFSDGSYDKCNFDFQPTDIIYKIEKRYYSEEPYYTFSVEKNKFVSGVLNADPGLPIDSERISETVIVEFSSPNIAKPFHMGHLRSTVIGHFVANILSNSHKVIRVNYLGDWGTQFGLIQAGLKSMSLDIDNLTVNPLKVINEAYVRANNDVRLIDQAKTISSTLEKTDESKELSVWKKLKELTIKHLEETYRVLGIKFDEYTWESQYVKGFPPVIKKMKDLGLVEEINNQLQVCRGEQKTPLLKSDGTSLYLSRDIMAALDRSSRFKCKSIKYVIDKSQEDHVDTLKYVISTLTGEDIVDHVKFGKIIGMSTRKGTSVFLSDILDEVTLLMAQQQEKSPNTRDRSYEVTQTLAITTLIVYLLKQRRTKDFNFDWNMALMSKGDSGIKLQYTHSRLCSLEKNCGVKLPSECQPHLINEPEALDLVALLDGFEQARALSEVTLESYYLVKYAFKLCNMASLCLKKLLVKGEDTSTAEQRLLLFHKTRITLNKTMSILGLKPLSSM